MENRLDSESVKFLYTGSVKIFEIFTLTALSLSLGCAPELDSGTYFAELEGSQTRLAGASDTFSAAAQVSVALVKTAGRDTYHFTVCDGFLDFWSSFTCFENLPVVDGPDGLVGSIEEYFSFYEDGVDCSGTEKLTLGGEIISEEEAEISLGYILTLNEYSDPQCVERYSDRPYLVDASGTLRR